MYIQSEVKIARSAAVRFPDRCVRCGELQPGGTIRVWTHVAGWWTLLGLFGWPFHVDVPACRGCRFPIRWQIWGRFLVTCLIVAVSLFVAKKILGDFKGPLRIGIAFGFGLLCWLPYGIWTTLFAPFVGVFAETKIVGYVFRDAEYAAEFAELNGVEVDDYG